MKSLIALTTVLLSVLAPISLADQNDALAPKSLATDALTGPLHTVTVTTASLE